MSKYVFLDVETQYSHEDVGGWHPEQMELSIAVTYDYANNYNLWTEEGPKKLLDYLQRFDFIVGFNLLDFDYKVLSPYDEDYILAELEAKTIDILQLVEAEVGYKVALNNLTECTLKQKKSGDGLKAVKLWKANRLNELYHYCKQDVSLTVSLFEYIQVHGKLYYAADGYRRTVSIELPEESQSRELDIKASKTWLNGYFDSLLAGDTIGKKQVRLLREKVGELIEKLELQVLFSKEVEDLADEDVEEDIEDEGNDEVLTTSVTRPGSSGNTVSFNDVADDLPF